MGRHTYEDHELFASHSAAFLCMLPCVCFLMLVIHCKIMHIGPNWRSALASRCPRTPMHITTSAAPSSTQHHASWDEALTKPTAAAVPDTPSLLTAHPAVGACKAECAAWEDALQGSSTAPVSQPGHGELYAVVECGSHSTRLLLSTGSSDILRLTRDTHLGALGSSKAAAPQHQQQQAQPVPAAATATLQAVQEYAQILQQHQQQLRGVAAVATAAVRKSPEGPQVAAAISETLQCPVHVLTAAQEARLAFKGASWSLSNSSSDNTQAGRLCLVVDLGGCSTELAAGVAGQDAQQVASIPLGCLSIQQAAASSSTGSAAAGDRSDGAAEGQQLLAAAQGILNAHKASLAGIRTALEDARLAQAQEQEQQQQPGQLWQQQQQHQVQPQVVVIATGGSATTLAALQLQLSEYSHEAVHMSLLTRQQVQQLMQQYLQASLMPAGRQDWPSWLTPARGSSLAPGCAGLLVLMDWLGVKEVVVSDCDLLDGVVADMQQGGTF